MKHLEAQTGENCSASIIIRNASKCKDVLRMATYAYTLTHTCTPTHTISLVYKHTLGLCVQRDFFSLTKSILFGCLTKHRQAQKQISQKLFFLAKQALSVSFWILWILNSQEQLPCLSQLHDCNFWTLKWCDCMPHFCAHHISEQNVCDARLSK